MIREEQDHGYTAAQRRVISSLGYLPAEPGVPSRCEAPLYGAVRVCTQSVRYDAGWPTSGPAHVESGQKTACYAIFGENGPSTMTVQFAPGSACLANLPSAAQRARLRPLAPDLYPYDEMSTQCSVLQGGPHNYQRDTKGHNLTVTTTASFPNANWGDVRSRYEVAMDVPYVCTDMVRSDYFAAIQTGLGSSYPMDRGDCMAEPHADRQTLDNYGFERLDIPSLNQTVSSELGPGCETNVSLNNASSIRVVEDRLDQSKYRVVVRGTCRNP